MSRGTGALDMIDRGFLRRYAAVVPHDVGTAVGLAVEHSAPQQNVAHLVMPPALSDRHAQPPDPPPDAPLVDRLLHAAPEAWEAVAHRVEDAHRDGATVIAVAGTRRGEGRTTLVECLRRTLTARGRRVDVVARPPCAGPDDGGAIVLVDAGVWFPGGPLRRAALERASLGCHAAILVRRAGQPECPARATAIEAVGLKLLGEVLTMVPTGGAVEAGG